MGIFGWSYPPGCSGTPYDEPAYCDVCGMNVDSDACICPECPDCGDYGNPKCYEEHSLTMSRIQVEMAHTMDLKWEAMNRYDDGPESKSYIDEEVFGLDF